MKKIILGALIVFTCVLTSSTYAQQQKGDVEAQLAGFYFTTIGTDFTLASGSIQTKLGYYFTDNFEFGVGPTLTITTVTTPTYTVNPTTGAVTVKNETKTEADGGMTAFFVFSFLTNTKTVPYFGAQYYKTSFKNTDDKGNLGVNAGVKFFFTRRAAFDFGGNYLFSLNKDSEGGLLLFAFGLSVLF